MFAFVVVPVVLKPFFKPFIQKSFLFKINVHLPVFWAFPNVQENWPMVRTNPGFAPCKVEWKLILHSIETKIVMSGRYGRVYTRRHRARDVRRAMERAPQICVKRETWLAAKDRN
jgi:hypothetical protein